MASIQRNNLAGAVESALQRVKEELLKTQSASSPPRLMQDLSVALLALETIQAEVTGKAPPRDKKSAIFIQYMIDEGESALIDKDLSDAIVKIEDLYNRFGA